MAYIGIVDGGSVERVMRGFWYILRQMREAEDRRAEVERVYTDLDAVANIQPDDTPWRRMILSGAIEHATTDRPYLRSPSLDAALDAMRRYIDERSKRPSIKGILKVLRGG